VRGRAQRAEAKFDGACKTVKVALWTDLSKMVKVSDPPETLPPPYGSTEKLDAQIAVSGPMSGPHAILREAACAAVEFDAYSRIASFRLMSTGTRNDESTVTPSSCHQHRFRAGWQHAREKNRELARSSHGAFPPPAPVRLALRRVR
jgi:hypothetical protein